MSLDYAERLARLRLIRSETIGPITFYRLIARYGSAVKTLEKLPDIFAKSSRQTPPIIFSHDAAIEEINALKSFGGRMVMFGDDDYPQWLSTVEDTPPVLSILGDSALLSQSSIAIVGARNASANAKKFTHSLAQDLGKKGQIIVSGLARGIDTYAHLASLETGTIAVVAGGLDEIYPTENTQLFHDIAKQGCIISEMPFGTKPTAHHFPRRNRIVSALSRGVVIVEASLQSGSLITARCALEQGREVFAVPGFPGDPRAAGPNSLIQNGAKLIQNADDILEELMTLDNKMIQVTPSSFDTIAESFTPFDHEQPNDLDTTAVQDIILEALSSTPLAIDDISQTHHIPIQSVHVALLEMELMGQIHRHPGNRVSRVI